MLERHDLLGNPGQWHEWYGDRPGWVFTHRSLPAVPGVDLRFVSGDVAASYDAMAAAAGDRDVWVVGGGDLVGQFDDAGLLDEVVAGICPVTLGAGAPLLPRRITSDRMRIAEVMQSGQQVKIRLAVERR